MNITDLTVCQTVSEIKNKRFSAEDAVKAYLRQIDCTGELNSFITVCGDTAVSAARRVDNRLLEGESLPLAGVTVAVKDNIRVRGMRTTCGSLCLKDYVSASDARVIALLKRAGAVVIGKTNMDEFAMGSTDEYSAYGAVKNVSDTSRVPGGSSGGSANSVAAHQAACALGTDTGGSIRQPAAYCGVVGLKPTARTVNNNGLLGMSPSFDCIGPITRTTNDAALVYSVISGRDVKPTESVTGLAVGIADEFESAVAGASADIKRAYENAQNALVAAGAQLKRVKLKSFGAALSAYHVLSSAEASATLCGYIKKGMDGNILGDEAVRRMLTGRFVVSGENYEKYYVRAARARAAITAEYNAALDICDVLLCPTTPSVAQKIGMNADPDKVHGCDAFLSQASLAGLPSVSVPFGSEDGLPIGMQIIGRRMCEKTVLGFAQALERANAI